MASSRSGVVPASCSAAKPLANEKATPSMTA
jgi:hypothetical protein